MLVIHLNNGKVIRTRLKLNILRQDLEDCNTKYIVIKREINPHEHEFGSVQYSEDLYKETLIDKNAIDFIDVIEL